MTAGGSAPPASPVLVIATTSEAAGAGLRIAGLTVIERALKQIHRSGHVAVIASDGTCALPAPLPAGTAVHPVASTGDIEALASALGLPPRVAADVVRPTNRDLSGGLRVTDEATRLAAEDAVFAELLRGDLGVVARALNKPLSFRLTRYVLCRLPLTPNHVTLGAALVGLTGAGFIATGRPSFMLLGFLLAHVQSVLDGCDGELARVRFQQSALGEWLDTVVDDGLNLSLMAAIGLGLHHLSGATLDLVAGGAATAMMLVYNVVAYRELVRQGEGGEVLKVRWWFARRSNLKERFASAPRFSLSRLALAPGRRDFFLFAWLLLAAAGLYRVILLYAFILALVSFVTAIGQIVYALRGRPA